MADQDLMPVVFVSHGTPLMSCTETESQLWWQKFGKEALANDIKGVVYINAHWAELDDRVRVGTKAQPGKIQMAPAPREVWENYQINGAPELGRRIVSLLRQSGFPDVEEDQNADWPDACITPSLWMFPNGTPPATTVSLNARYDPVFHVRMGQALQPLRKQGILIIASGATVHNIFRANFIPLILKKDTLQKGSKPAKWATEFDQSIHDIIEGSTGSATAGGLVRLTQSPRFMDAHPSNDHYYPLLVVSGTLDESESCGRAMAQTYEMGNLINTQYMWGQFPSRQSTAV